jgi:hypothetical protein
MRAVVPAMRQGTFAFAINPAGTITGNYFASNQYHGFLRATTGGEERTPKVTFTTFDPPASLGTSPSAINSAGTITGSHFDASFMQHGFLRSPDHPDE